MLFFVMKRPFIGMAVWVWTAFIVPTYLVFGFASNIRFNYITVIATLLSWVICKNKPKIIIDGIAILVIIFFIHSTLSAVTAIYDSNELYLEWEKSLRAFILFIFLLLLVQKKEHLVLLSWGLILSVGFYGFVEGLKFIVTAGNHHIVGPGRTVIADNNQLAAAFNMTIPFAYFLYKKETQAVLKYAALSILITTIIAIFGTYSRGGAVGLFVLTLYALSKSQHKFKFAVLLTVALFSFLAFVPDKWMDRFSTVEKADQDKSFLGRVVAWKISTLIALDHPILGGGFHAVQTNDVWNHYGQAFEKLDFLIDTPHALDMAYKSAHSIYFQVLGDQGFVGLFIYLFTVFIAFRKLNYVIKLPLDDGLLWLKELARMLKLSLIAFLVCGALLSLAYFEYLYIVLAMIISVLHIAKQAHKQML